MRLTTRNGRDATATYPELHGLGTAVGSHQVLLDGEVIAVDASGRPSFEALQPRMHVTDAGRARHLAAGRPVSYMIFDLLHLDGSSTMAMAYAERRRLLSALDPSGDRWAVPPAYDGPGIDILQVARSTGMEGVVAKRVDSPYQPGRRTRDWVKVKVTRTQEVVAGGWSPGKGARSHRIGALLLGLPGHGGLQYVGKVGTGFTDEMLASLQDQLGRLRRAGTPFVTVVPTADAAGAVWVEPELVGEVRFTQWTAAGRLRHPSWRGLRPEKAPTEVAREP